MIAPALFDRGQGRAEAIALSPIPQNLKGALLVICDGDDTRFRAGFPSERAEINGGTRQDLDRTLNPALEANRQLGSLRIVRMKNDVVQDLTA